MAVTETWLTDAAAETILYPGYKFIHKSRGDTRGGGIGFLVQDNIEFHKIDLLPASSSSSYESMFINISCSRGADMLIGVIYRPPGTKLELFNAEIETLLTTLTTKKYANKKVFLTGDFNIDILASQTHAPTGAFIDCMLMHHFLPLILQPTRITVSSATLIDNIFTNSHDGILESAILTADISDHLPVITWIDITPTNLSNLRNLRKTRTFSNDNIMHFRSLLDNTDWKPVHDLCVLNESDLSYKVFVDTCKVAYNTAFPLRPEKLSKKILLNSPG